MAGGERKEEKDKESQGEADRVRRGREGGEEREGEEERDKHRMEGGERGKKKESHKDKYRHRSQIQKVMNILDFQCGC